MQPVIKKWITSHSLRNKFSLKFSRFGVEVNVSPQSFCKLHVANVTWKHHKTRLIKYVFKLEEQCHTYSYWKLALQKMWHFNYYRNKQHIISIRLNMLTLNLNEINVSWILLIRYLLLNRNASNFQPQKKKAFLADKMAKYEQKTKKEAMICHPACFSAVCRKWCIMKHSFLQSSSLTSLCAPWSKIQKNNSSKFHFVDILLIYMYTYICKKKLFA